MLSLIVFLPLFGALVLLFLPGENAQKWWSVVITTITFIVSLLLFVWWRDGYAGMQFVERHEWVPGLHIQYYLGVDGISLFLVLLTTFLGPIVTLFSWDAVKENVRTYLMFLLWLETGILGVFVALDLVLFYVFWDMMLVPMYFLIGKWGHDRRIYAALKFFIYTAAGSAFMLIAILVLYFKAGTFDLMKIYQMHLPLNVQIWAFVAFALAFAIKVPLFPFHTWLPDAHVQAPTAGSVILAGVLLKMGTYGFLRFAVPMFPDAAKMAVPVISIMAIIGIIYGALVALVQEDLKSLVAYSSIAHLGFVVLGIFALNIWGVGGAVLQMVNHGLSTGALFLLVGMLYNRRHTRLIREFGGLWKQVPVYGFFFLIIMLSSIGLPGLNGFVGEFTILIGAFKAHPVYAILAATGVILAAWYLLRAFRAVMEGPLENPANMEIRDLNWREIAVLVPIVIMVVLIGLFPNIFFDKINPSVVLLLKHLGG